MTIRAKRGSILVAVLVLLLGGAGLVLSEHRVVRQPAVQTVSAKPVSQADVQASINRATAYMRANLGQVQPYQRLIIDFLQRKFQLDPVFSAQVTPITDDASGTIETEQYQALERIVYPNQFVTSLPTFNNSADTMVIYAANCDHISFPGNYQDVLAHNLREGSYYTTHVVFAFGFIHDNGCAVSSTWTTLQQQALKATRALAANPNTDKDLRYEAIAFTLAYGSRAAVQPAWIRQIIAEQRHDGGWGGAANYTTLQDHQTVLALWALLEYAHPNAPKEPMIRRPD